MSAPGPTRPEGPVQATGLIGISGPPGGTTQRRYYRPVSREM